MYERRRRGCALHTLIRALKYHQIVLDRQILSFRHTYEKSCSSAAPPPLASSYPIRCTRDLNSLPSNYTHTHSAFTASEPSKMHYFAPRTALQTFCALAGNIFEKTLSGERNQAPTMVGFWWIKERLSPAWDLPRSKSRAEGDLPDVSNGDQTFDIEQAKNRLEI